DLNAAFYDNGFYNIGVTPTVEDIGRGGADEFGSPLSWSRQYLFQANDIMPINFRIFGLPKQGLVCEPDKVDKKGNCKNDILGFIDADTGEFFPVCEDNDGDGACGPGGEDGEDIPLLQRVAVDGAFKTPTVRNVELTGPFMHNGSLATLLELVEFYDRGGNFCKTNLVDLDPDIQVIGFNTAPDPVVGINEEQALIKFMIALTDDRVRYEKAPFDHPQLFIPNGHPGDQIGIDEDTGPLPPNNVTQAVDDFRVLPAVGADGGQALMPFLWETEGDDVHFEANEVDGECSKGLP
ncbi:MAG: hypothetical protein JRD88_03645, partial [Deltaproteobacteria bacterium]|nr:hypothetical protein [Deltaproteobacteria bacterium]